MALFVAVREYGRRDWRWLLAGAGVLVVLTTAPYLYAWAHAPAGGAFGGLLANPLDGQTYLAKMALGAGGEWLFRATFTSEPHAGAFINTYYLFLGQLAGRLGLPLPLMYHLARLVNGLLFMAGAYLLCIVLAPAHRRLAWLLLFFSSGLGWLSATLGYLTADLLVPEAIAFYALYTNPHFPLALAALTGLFAALFAPFNGPPATRLGAWRTAGALLCAALLALTQAFLFILVGVVAGLFLLLRWRRTSRFPWIEAGRGLLAALPAAALTIPQVLALSTHPILRGISAQDINLSPPLWDYALSFGVLMPLAVWGGWRLVSRRDETGLFLVLWAGVNLALAYIPLNLQRRLIIGAQIPLALLAAEGLSAGLLREAAPTTARRVKTLVLACAVLSNLFLLAMGVLAAVRRDAQLYLLPGEPAALDWLANQSVDGAVVALPRTSAFIPGRSNHPVYYGHPMETLDAKRKETEVRALFAGKQSDLLGRPDVGWLYLGPYERQEAAPALLEALVNLEVAYQRAGVTIYSTRDRRDR